MDLGQIEAWIKENQFLSFWIIFMVIIATLRFKSDRKNWRRLAEKYGCDKPPTGMKLCRFQTGQFGNSPYPNSLKVGSNGEGIYVGQMLSTSGLFIPWSDLQVSSAKHPISKAMTFLVHDMKIEFVLCGKSMKGVESHL